MGLNGTENRIRTAGRTISRKFEDKTGKSEKTSWNKQGKSNIL